MASNHIAEVSIGREDMGRIVVEDKDLRSDVDMAIANTVNAIIAAAIRYKASDIHFEPMDNELKVRIRIDGELCPLVTMEKEAEQQIIARLKVMCKMKIDDQRLPQDGRISLTYRDQPFSRMYNIRASVIPKQLPDRPAEKIVLRILGSMVEANLDSLHFSSYVRTQLDNVIAQPQGMFILTGPTGSGKSTTLNAMLTKMNKESVNILTIEDPIEYHIRGITQVQTYEMIGLNFASALRAFLRQDPDIIMVGEIRDSDTAQIAVRAALTGHLVLSTLHTNDAPSALLRLMDLGIETYLLTGSLMGIMAQRLVRTLCPACKEPYDATARDLSSIGMQCEDPDSKFKIFRPKGCPKCLSSGFKGRLGIFELLMMNAQLRDLVRDKNDIPINEIRKVAKESGMKELWEEGLGLVMKGITSVEEVQKVVYTCEFR